MTHKIRKLMKESQNYFFPVLFGPESNGTQIAMIYVDIHTYLSRKPKNSGKYEELYFLL